MFKRKNMFNQETQMNVSVVRATVVDKYMSQRKPYTYGNFSSADYIVVFLVGDKKLSFHVSEYSFQNYKINEYGTLRFSGKNLIDFS